MEDSGMFLEHFLAEVKPAILLDFQVPSIQRRKGSNAVVHDLIQEVGSIENPRTYVQVSS